MLCRHEVVVCPRGDQRNTLLHEGWRLVQSRCLKGFTYLSEDWLRARLSRRDRKELDFFYKSDKWQREAEARYLASQSLERYFEAFDALCAIPAMNQP